MSDTPAPAPTAQEAHQQQLLLRAVPAEWFRSEHARIDRALRDELDIIESERPTAPARTFARGLAWARAYGAMQSLAGELVERGS